MSEQPEPNSAPQHHTEVQIDPRYTTNHFCGSCEVYKAERDQLREALRRIVAAWEEEETAQPEALTEAIADARDFALSQPSSRDVPKIDGVHQSTHYAGFAQPPEADRPRFRERGEDAIARDSQPPSDEDHPRVARKIASLREQRNAALADRDRLRAHLDQAAADFEQRAKDSSRDPHADLDWAVSYLRFLLSQPSDSGGSAS